MKYNVKFQAKILEQTELAPGIFSMWIRGGEAVKTAQCGQFVSVYTKDKTSLLPRPVSICELDRENRRIRLVYRVVGKGTSEFSQMREKEEVEVLFPLGTGFDTEKAGKSALLFGGGIGIPPLLEVAKRLSEQGVLVTAVLGYRSSDTFLTEDFRKYAKVIVATDDGSLGIKGTVVDAAIELSLSEEKRVTSIYSCGPLPMLRAVKSYGEERGIITFVSLEERMACGIGVCLGCVCESTETDSHSYVKNKRVCKDGPVFLSEEVTF